MYMTHQNKTVGKSTSTFWKGMLASSWTSLFHARRPGFQYKTVASTPPMPYTGFRDPRNTQRYDMLVASDVIPGLSTIQH